MREPPREAAGGGPAAHPAHPVVAGGARHEAAAPAPAAAREHRHHASARALDAVAVAAASAPARLYPQPPELAPGAVEADAADVPRAERRAAGGGAVGQPPSPTGQPQGQRAAAPQT